MTRLEPVLAVAAIAILLDSPVVVSFLPHQNQTHSILSPGASGQPTYASGWSQLWDFTSRPGDSANLTNR